MCLMVLIGLLKSDCFSIVSVSQKSVRRAWKGLLNINLRFSPLILFVILGEIQYLSTQSISFFPLGFLVSFLSLL